MDGTRYPASKEFAWSELEVAAESGFAVPDLLIRLRALTGANLPTDLAIDGGMLCQEAAGVKVGGGASPRVGHPSL